MVGENILGVFLAVPRVVGENILGVFLAVPRVVGENVLGVFQRTALIDFPFDRRGLFLARVDQMIRQP